MDNDNKNILSTEDIALLRRFEPVLRFTYGEQFYPMDAERYIAAARLYCQRPGEAVVELVPRHEITPESLVQSRDDPPGTFYYLNVADSLNPAQVLHFYRTSTLRNFYAGPGRLTRVGLVARLADMLFSLTLLLRGKVPGGLAAAAALLYQQWQATDERYCYYGRVVHENGYIVLQYWFFYAFNDWRSSFNGVNDHEADWEMMTVYVAPDEEGVDRACWLAYSSHEFEGDDLRRRCDDPELEWIGEHPVVYVGAGSHANYFAQGEYLPVAEVPYTGRLLRVWRRIQRFWRVTLRQGDEYIELPDLGFFRIPFVDYARGDGLSVGPEQPYTWEMCLLQNSPAAAAPAWVDGYRGLWGLYTRDPIAGEDAPAGPKYNRNGTIRKMWYDPLGWAGLDKVPPPLQTVAVLQEQLQLRREEQALLQEQIATQTRLLIGLEIEAEAIRGQPHLQPHAGVLQKHIRDASEALDELKKRRATNVQVLERGEAFLVRLTMGRNDDPRSHLRLPQLPSSRADMRLGRLAEAWAALSIGVLMLGFVVITLFFASAWRFGLLALLGVYFFIEAVLRRQIQILIRYLVVGLALVTTLLLLYEFFWPVVATIILLAGVLIIVENIRELW